MIRKSILLTFLIGLLISSGLLAQNRAGEYFIGIKGGVNLSNLYSSEVDDNNVRTGFHAGVYARNYLSDNFFIQPEIMYSSKGFEATDDGFTEELELQLDYIDVPIIFGYNILLPIEVHVGPYISFLANDPSGSFDTDLIDGEFTADKDDFNSLDYGVAIGAGLNLEFIDFIVRYNLGLAPVASSGIPEEALGSSKNSVLQITVALHPTYN